MLTAGKPFCARRASSRTRLSFDLNLCCVLDDDKPLIMGYEPGQDIEKGCLAGAGADQDVLAVMDMLLELQGQSLGQRIAPHQIVHGEVTAGQLADGERNAVDAAGRKDGSHAAAVREAGVEDGAGFRNVVAETTGDVLDGDKEKLLGQSRYGHGRQIP